MTDLEKMIGNEVKELKTLYDMSEAEYDRDYIANIVGFASFRDLLESDDE